MLRGRFGDTSGRPYVEGRLVFPVLRLRGDISFVVDTGADRSVLMPLDGMRIGVDYNTLSSHTESVGMGGISRDFEEQALVGFAEPNQNIYVYNIKIIVASPHPDIMDVPSLLGRDILDHWRIIYNPSKKLLSVRFLSADFIIPIA